MKKILRLLFKKKKVPLTVYKGVRGERITSYNNLSDKESLPISDYDGMGNFSRIGKP